MKKLLFVSLLTGIAFIANAQNYKNALGIRGGFSNGITFKHFFSSSSAFELIVANRWKGYNLTGLYEKHKDLGSGFDWYYGIGGHIGRWHGYDKHPWFKDDKDYSVIGIDLILGIEYTIPGAPINLSLDYKPGYNLVGYNGFWGDEGAFLSDLHSDLIP